MRQLLKDKIPAIFLGLSLALLLAGLVLILINIDGLSSPLILHINAYTGVDMMGSINHLWLLISMGALMFILNLGLANTFFYRERIASYIIIGVNFIISLFVLISIANIIALN